MVTEKREVLYIQYLLYFSTKVRSSQDESEGAQVENNKKKTSCLNKINYFYGFYYTLLSPKERDFIEKMDSPAQNMEVVIEVVCKVKVPQNE